MNAVARDAYLRALGVAPLYLRRSVVAVAETQAARPQVAPAEVAAPVASPAPAASEVALRICRLALLPDTAELADPALSAMYAALSAAVGKAGLQSVRPCDVEADPSAAVMVFGAAPLPADVPAVRVLRADPLRVLHADRERKRQLWERLQALGRGETG